MPEDRLIGNKVCPFQESTLILAQALLSVRDEKDEVLFSIAYIFYLRHSFL